MTEHIRLDAQTAGLIRPSPLTGVFRRLIRTQTGLALRFDQLLPAQFRIDGNRDFIEHLVPAYLQPGMTVYDIGGGKNPLISRDCKSALALTVIGLDIDARQFRAAPRGAYDRTICADICNYAGGAEADVVICQALLEHVLNVESAVQGIARVLKPGGRALIFVPCRNALYARINQVLPELLKRRILFAIFPEMHLDHGFPAHYDRCTPGNLEQIAERHDLVVEQRRVYFESGYFRFCLPLHILWRMWLLLFRLAAGDEAAETVSLVFRKRW